MNIKRYNVFSPCFDNGKRRSPRLIIGIYRFFHFRVKNTYYDIIRFFKDIFYYLPFKGYWSKDLWSLDYALAKWLLPRLKAFRAGAKYGIPMWCFSEEAMNHMGGEIAHTPDETGKCTICRLDEELAIKKWHDTLDDIIFAFQAIADENYDSMWYWDESKQELLNEDSPESKRCQRGLNLFHEHLFSFWT